MECTCLRSQLDRLAKPDLSQGRWIDARRGDWQRFAMSKRLTKGAHLLDTPTIKFGKARRPWRYGIEGFTPWLVAFVSAGVAGCSGTPAADPSAGTSTSASSAVGASNATSSTVNAVASDALAGKTVPPCPIGAAHPDVCCTGGPFLPAACAENTAAPFGACDSDALTFPDPTQCCPLGGGACEVISTADGGSASGTCSFLCGPGSYWPEQVADAATVSFETCTPSTSPDDPCVFCCDPAEGCPTNQTSCGGGPGCSAGNTSLQCASCPGGWSVPASGQFDLCCRSGPHGGTECFSQSAQIALNNFGLVGVCVSDSATACTCKEATSDGHVVAAHCDTASSPPCVCSIDGTTTATIASFAGCATLFTVRPPPDDGGPSPPTVSGAGTLLVQCPQSM
jgi:hypothetical protein